MKVLLTGGSGFIGKHCLDTLLKHGHTVVTTVRSNAKGDQILQDYPQHSSKLSYSVVEDMSRTGAFDHSVQSSPAFDAVLHTASPFHFNAQDMKRDMIEPARRGTVEILESIKRFAPSVKRVVVTSSFAAIMNPAGGVPVYTADHWNPITMEQSLSNGFLAYIGSKKFAEQAAWDFLEKEKPGFALTTVNPVLVFGPVTNNLKSLENVNTSNERFRDMIQGKMKDGVAADSFQFVDVRDVALAHVAAIEVPEAKVAGKRFIAAAGPYSNEAIAQIIKDNFPQFVDKLPEAISVPTDKPPFEIDTTPTQQVLGVSFKSLEESTIDTVKSLLEIDP